MSRILMPLADGCEEMEVVIVADVLRRAGLEVVMAGLKPGVITAARGTGLLPDTVWDETDPARFDMLVLPGGMGGTQALCEHAGVQAALKSFHAQGRWIGAICAAPLALFRAGMLPGPAFTCYPGVEKEMPGTRRSEDRTVMDGRLITGQGPGTAFEFALKIVEELCGLRTAREVRDGLLL